MSGEIKNPEAYLAAALRRRTERFDRCFPRGISLGDIDSFSEIGGAFLFIEWKLTGQVLPDGQRRALRLQSKQPRTTVLVLWTKEDGEITHIQNLGDDQGMLCCDESLAFATIKRWADRASGQEPVDVTGWMDAW